jgi:hypothetical protein
MASRSNYWSCSKFADWLRGTDKPYSSTGSGWKQWKNEAKQKHSFRYWLAEEGLDKVQNFVNWPLDKLYSMKYYAVNRWIDQSNALVAHPKHIKPGQYQDFDNRILICLFDELVDFVEIEKAYCNYRWSEEKQKGMKWWQVGRWRTRTWRSAEAGIEHLKWEMGLTDEEWLDEDKKADAQPTTQSIAAKEIYDLYIWWTEVYHNRPDPYDVSGWSEYCENKRERGIDFLEDDPDEKKFNTRAMHEKIREMEKSYEEEDTEMLIRLIKVRASLWT